MATSTSLLIRLAGSSSRLSTPATATPSSPAGGVRDDVRRRLRAQPRGVGRPRDLLLGSAHGGRVSVRRRQVADRQLHETRPTARCGPTGGSWSRATRSPASRPARPVDSASRARISSQARNNPCGVADRIAFSTTLKRSRCALLPRQEEESSRRRSASRRTASTSRPAARLRPSTPAPAPRWRLRRRACSCGRGRRPARGRPC